MSHGFHLKTALPAVVAALLAGCSLAPDYHRPAAPVPGQYPDADAVNNTGERSASAVAPQVQYSSDLGWSEFFRDPQLRALIRLALDNNRDMRVAVGRVQEARAQYGIVQSDQFPTIGAGANTQHTRNPENLRAGGPDSPGITHYYQAGLGMT